MYHPPCVERYPLVSFFSRRPSAETGGRNSSEHTKGRRKDREIFLPQSAPMAWYHDSGHKWNYESDDTVGSMVVRFSKCPDPMHDSCGCSCGFCSPTDPHRAEDGCVCRLLSCPCIDEQS